MAALMKAAMTTYWQRGPADSLRHSVDNRYCAMFDCCGIIPSAVLPSGSADPESILKGYDLLVMTGGDDPAPFLFGEENRGSRNPRVFRPAWDMELYRAARKKGMPVLGICLGMQLIGIAEGSVLIQDIASLWSREIDHDGSLALPLFHRVVLSRGSLLESVIGNEAMVSSFHHQSLAMSPAGFHVAAQSPDGVIEAIESLDGRVIGVQWHPERDCTGLGIAALVRGIAEEE